MLARGCHMIREESRFSKTEKQIIRQALHLVLTR